MISRRTVVGGLALLAAPVLSGCAARRTVPPGAAASVAPPVAPPPIGLDAVIDMNHNTQVSDFGAVRRRGNILAIIHKASEGVDWVDPLYAARRPQAEAAGLLWGAYHFGTGQHPGAEQAAAFLAAAQPGPTTLMALDLEPNERHPSNTMQTDQAEEFVQTIYRATGRLPLVYTHPRWANGQRYGRAGVSLGRAIDPQSILARCDLWLADYRREPELPWAWADRGWRLWQYAGDERQPVAADDGPQSRVVEGVDTCDRNLYLGDMAGLYAFWSGGVGKV